MPSRRAFLTSLAAVPLMRRQSASSPSLRLAVLVTMLPDTLTYQARFELARAAGFEAIEMRTVSGPAEAVEILQASRRTGLRIHSVMNVDHWEFPLSSADPASVARSVAGMETSLRNAAAWGADAVLLVPAVVDAKTGYRDAWDRSQRVIKERLLPLAQELKVVIAVEEVWNRFLVSPIEFARYVDEFQSPWVKAYFDVGNVVFHGYPQDWIRTLGPRIVKIHLKDFQLDRPNGRFAWKNLGEGDIDWTEVRRALTEIHYRGFVTTELAGGSPEYLADVAARVGKLLAPL
jgi:L-ribulose-5-phosphate 3-epimerase